MNMEPKLKVNSPFISVVKNGDDYDVILDAPPRSMWGQAEGQRGYCGETSFQTSGIFFGNWISQQIARDHADGVELLIGENEIKAAKGLKYKFEKFRSEDEEEDPGDEFLEWARE